MATPKKTTGFDLQTLEQMTPPIKIRIERKMKTGGKEPIPLPQAEWSKEDAEKIEQIVLNDISGGGSYDAQMSDANGKSFTWSFAYPEGFFPPKVPAGSQGAYVATPNNGSSNGSSGPSIPAYTPFAAAPGYQFPPPPPYQPPQHGHSQGQSQPSPGNFASPSGSQGGYLPPMYPYGYPSAYTPAYGGYPSPYPPPSQSSPATSSSELEQVKKELEKARLESLATEHRREREAAEARHGAELSAMRDELRRFAEQNAKKPARDDDDPVLLQLKQQNEMMRQQLEAVRIEMSKRDEKAEREASERRHQESMAQMQAQHRESMAQLQRQIESLGSNKQDPTLAVLMEMQRSANQASMEQARAANEIAREQARVAQEAPQKMMDMMRTLKDTSGQDQVLSNLASAYEGANGMVMRNMEMMNNFIMNSQGSPVAGLIGDGIQGAKEVLAAFVTSKQKAEMAKSRAEQAKQDQIAAVQYAQAQAQAAQAQAQMMGAQQRAQIHEAPAPEAAPEVQAATQEVKAAETAQAKAEKEKASREEKLFGDIWPQVEELREWILKEGEAAVDPMKIAAMIVQAALQVEQHALKVPAFVLLTTEQYSELIDYTLPRASNEFAAICVESLHKVLAKVQADGPEVLMKILGAPPDEEDDGEAEEGGDEDDDLESDAIN